MANFDSTAAKTLSGVMFRMVWHSTHCTPVTDRLTNPLRVVGEGRRNDCRASVHIRL